MREAKNAQAPSTVAVQVRKMPYGLHMSLKLMAVESGKTLEELIIEALGSYVTGRRKPVK